MKLSARNIAKLATLFPKVRKRETAFPGVRSISPSIVTFQFVPDGSRFTGPPDRRGTSSIPNTFRPPELRGAPGTKFVPTVIRRDTPNSFNFLLYCFFRGKSRGGGGERKKKEGRCF